jgi:SagB-type dehydrogenase family enzyme
MKAVRIMTRRIVAFSVLSVCACIGVLLVLSLAQEETRKEKAVALPEVKKKGSLSVEEAIDRRRSVRDYAKAPLTMEQVSQLLWAAQGTTAGGTRATPSAGATYPLEIYLVAGDVTGLDAGLYRYLNSSHKLVKVNAGDMRKSLCEAALSQAPIEKAPAIIAIAAKYERTAGRYGNRAQRYVHIEVGHVGQNIYLQCESLSLTTVAIGAFDDAKVKKALGIAEEPLYIMPVGKKK